MGFLDRFLGRSPEHAATSAAVRDRLIRGRWYRIFTRVSEDLIQQARANAPPGKTPQMAAQDAVSQALTCAGFDVRTSTEDPFKLGTWTSIARWRMATGEPLDAPGITIFQAREVESPPDVLPRLSPDETGLDAGMTPGMIAVVRRAMESEHDPRRLNGMATSFDVDFPITASVLRNKARIEGYARTLNKSVAARFGSGPNPASFGAQLFTLSEPTRLTLEELEASVSGPALGHRARHGFREQAPVLDCVPGLAGPPDADEEVDVRLDMVGSLDVDPRDLALGFGETYKAISDDDSLVADPHRLTQALSAADVRFTPEVVALAVAAARQLGGGLCLARTDVVLACLPRGPLPVPRSALQLAHALERPEGSLVDMPRELSGEMKDLRYGASLGDAGCIRALYEVKRARRVLDREAWIDHVARAERAENAQAKRTTG